MLLQAGRRILTVVWMHKLNNLLFFAYNQTFRVIIVIILIDK